MAKKYVVVRVRGPVGIAHPIEETMKMLRLHLKNTCVIVPETQLGMIKKVMKKFFRLNSPKKGFGRRGIKRAYNKSGALGYRGTDINELVKRMV